MAIYIKSATGVAKLIPEVKLYDTTGKNTDAAMTQKAVSDKFTEYLPLNGGTVTGTTLFSVILPKSSLASTVGSDTAPFKSINAMALESYTLPYGSETDFRRSVTILGTSGGSGDDGYTAGSIQLETRFGNGKSTILVLNPAYPADHSTSNRYTVTFPNKDGTVAYTDDIPDISSLVTQTQHTELKAVVDTKADDFVDITTDLEITTLTTPGKYRFVQGYDSSRIATNKLTFQNGGFISYKPSFCYIYVDKINRFDSPYITADLAYDDEYSFHEGLRVTVKYISPSEEEVVQVFDMYSEDPNGGGK